MDESKTADLKIAIVHVEPCLAFVGDSDTPEEVCDGCGWFVDEHLIAAAA